MTTEENPSAIKLNTETLKNPKVLLAAGVAALGGLLYAGEGFTIEFSTCQTSTEEAAEEPTEASEEESPQAEPEEAGPEEPAEEEAPLVE